jgi:hypothetical protein
MLSEPGAFRAAFGAALGESKDPLFLIFQPRS